jgi:glycosyltransferase involved in cell wall biosynthesis
VSFVTIIIPTFNRAHLIGETLDSILLQTYTNWECIIIDDGSNDDSDVVISKYCSSDNRFQFIKRPKNKPKGGNSCRNIGLDNAKGDYIVFFDSDDLMTPDHLQTKLVAIQKNQCDYVITRTQYFNDDNTQIDKNYTGFKTYKINAFNYISQKINWLTLDVCLKRELAQQVSFNEQLQSGQEYNYYSKLVHKSVNAIFIDKVVSLRRAHDTSIRSQLKTKEQMNESYFKKSWITYLDVKDYANKETRKFLIKKASSIAFKTGNTFSISFNKLLCYIVKEVGFKSIYLLLYYFSMKIFGKGNYFMSRFNKN